MTLYFNMPEITTIFIYVEYDSKPLNTHNLVIFNLFKLHAAPCKCKCAFNFSPLATFSIPCVTGKRDGQVKLLQKLGWDIGKNPHREAVFLPSSVFAHYFE